MFLSSSLIKPAQRSQQMKRYQMPCSRKAASRNKPSTSLIMRRDPTQVFWTVETVPGMEVSCHLSACQHICLTERGQMWLVSCCFLVTLDQTQVTLICLRPQLQRQAQKPFYLFLFPRRAALWLHFRIANTHNHGPLHIYFVPNSFSVNLACQSGLNMAVITGHYESHVSIALLPMLTTGDTEIFITAIKKIPKRETRMIECAQELPSNALQV